MPARLDGSPAAHYFVSPRIARCRDPGRLFWIILARLRSTLVIFQPDTVSRWLRAGIRLFGHAVVGEISVASTTFPRSSPVYHVDYWSRRRPAGAAYSPSTARMRSCEGQGPISLISRATLKKAPASLTKFRRFYPRPHFLRERPRFSPARRKIENVRPDAVHHGFG